MKHYLDMIRYQSILALILASVAAFLVSCSSPSETVKAPTYTSAQLEQIQRYSEDVQTLRDRLVELPPLIQQKQWTEVESFIHGPLGELRTKMSRLARTLDPKTQANALQSAKNVFGHLILIDEAAQGKNIDKALRNYNLALEDFDTFLQFVPS